MKRYAAILLSILMALCIPCSALTPREQVGSDVSGFSSVLIGGEPVDGSIFGDHTVSAVIYWATWSEPCRLQMDILNEIGSEHPEFGVMGLLHVDATSTPETALAFMQGNGYDFPVFVCDDTWSEIVGQSMNIPQCFIVDSEGRIVEVWQAAFSSSETLLYRLRLWEAYCIADGDVNFDGDIDSIDALLQLRFALDLETPTELQFYRGDFNHDGVLDSMDALFTLRTALGL